MSGRRGDTDSPHRGGQAVARAAKIPHSTWPKRSLITRARNSSGYRLASFGTPANHSLMQREKFAYPMQKCSLRFVQTLTQSFFARSLPHGLQLDPAPSQCFG
jgi:hypothetical protein